MRFPLGVRVCWHCLPGWLHESQRHGRGYPLPPEGCRYSRSQRDTPGQFMASAAGFLHLYRAGPFRTPGDVYPRPNVVAEEASTASSNISRWCAALASRPGWRKP